MKAQRLFLFAALLLMLVVGFGAATRSARADSVLLVNATGDYDDGACDASDCTLREAIRFAQGNSGGTVQFAPNAFPQGGTVTLDPALRPMNIYYPTTVDGQVISNGQVVGTITVNGNGIPGVFFVNGTQFDVKNLTITGATGSAIANGGTLNVTNSTLSGNSYFAGAAIFNAGTLNLSDSTITGNTASEYGGGIYNTAILNVTDSTISDNHSDRDGGGIYNQSGTVKVTHSTLSGNSALNYAGGIYNGQGTTSVANSTLSANSAVGGGGIYAVGATLNLSNSIVRDSASGSGIYSVSSTVEVTNSTVSGNASPGGLGGIFYMDGSVTLKNSIVAGNVGYNCYPAVTDGGYNLEDSNSCGLSAGNHSQSGVDPLFDAGALTLQAGSPANDAADDSVCAADPVDNLDLRGDARPKGPHCDIGAFEMPRATLTVIKHVVNDNGGTKQASDFLMNVSAVNSASFAGAEAPGIVMGVAPGSFSVTETGAEGYTGSASSCTGSLADGSITTCTITNDDNAPPPSFTFSGFFQPVDNPPTVNVLKAGVSVPLKFSLHGDQGLNIFADGYPLSENMVCASDAPKDAIEQTVSAETGSLSYDAASDTYTYVWKTKKAWVGTCRKLVLRLSDGTDHKANFKFK